MVTIHEVWYGKSFVALAIRVLLLPLSLLYALGWQLYLLLYRLGVKKAQHPHDKIVCVGNLVAGGTGKTPTVVFVANCIVEMGYDVVIGCSGYGSPSAEGASVAPAGSLKASEWGDEPAEIRELLPNVPLIIGRARVTAATLCHQQFPNAVLLMDDGFQHMPLAKDVSIVIDPDISNHFTFLAGPYRESRGTGRKRADLVVPSEQFTHIFSNLTFTSSSGSSVAAPPSANVLAAIGRPDKFEKAIQESGVSIVDRSYLSDHDPLQIDLSTRPKDIPTIVTRKDWVKLKEIPENRDAPIVIAERTVTIEPVDEFKKWLKIKLG